MNYNNGMPQDNFYNYSKNELRKRALDFSEGDFRLFFTLLSLWENGIRTFACCKGHNNSKVPYCPYISFIIDENSNGLIQNLCNYYYCYDDDILINFSNYTKRNYSKMTITMYNKESKKNILNFILNYVNKNISLENNNKDLEYARYVLDYANKEELICSFQIYKDHMRLAFNPPDPNGHITELEDDYTLEDLLPLVKDKGEYPTKLVKCDSESIEKYINILYPNTYENQTDMHR